MKVSILISGEPRFCKEFDIFLERLTGFTEIHWYFVLWSKSTSAVQYHRHTDNGKQSVIVSEAWCDITEEWARKEFERLLPKSHTVYKVEVLDQNSLNFPLDVNSDGVTNISNAWKMFWGTNRAFKHVQDSGIKYDLVVKARPDLELFEELNLNRFQNIPNKVLAMPYNTAAGYGVHVSDLMTIGNQETMKIYADCVEWIPEYIKTGKIFHPETILGHYLMSNSINLINGGYGIGVRSKGVRVSDHLYYSDFGRWTGK